MTLSIVIVSYNARAHLENCLSSLAAAPPVTPPDITVVDNGSWDDSVAATRRGWPAVQVIAGDTNTGFAAANNAGIRATRGQLILLLNNDTIEPPGAIDHLCERLQDVSAAAVAGPRLVDATGRAELSFGPMISPVAELRQKAVMALYERDVAPVAAWVERESRREHFVDWVSGACLLVQRREAEAVGLLDERYFLYTEDVDFCAAIRARGRRILFTPAAQITHLRGRSRATVPDGMNPAYRRGHLAFYEKHHPRWAPLLRAYLRLKSLAGH
jgi:N-acetylglucosaminyl-diphospho-decaprenol L-rhamnosyltransferase